MADNVGITTGSNAQIATDGSLNVHYQRIKLNGGVEGDATPIKAYAAGESLATTPTGSTNGIAAGVPTLKNSQALGPGAMLTVGPGDWAANHTPAAAAQATVTQAAGAAGVVHVCTSISATLATGATAQAAAIQLNLRDGASGLGAILWSKQIILPANGVWEVNLSGLNIVGTAATAMTLEFSGAGATGSYESVSMTGFDATVD